MTHPQKQSFQGAMPMEKIRNGYSHVFINSIGWMELPDRIAKGSTFRTCFPYERDEIELLINLWNEGYDLYELAVIVRRTASSLYQRLIKENFDTRTLKMKTSPNSLHDYPVIGRSYGRS